MAGSIFPSQQRRAFLSSIDPRWRLKLGVSITAILLSLISIGLFAAAIPQWNANFFHSKGLTRGDWTDGISIGPLALNICFCIAGIAYSFISKRPVPPKLCVLTFSLILLALTPALFLAGHGSLFRHWHPSAVRNTDGLLVCNMLNVFTRECQPILYSIGELQIGGLVFGSLVWVLVFVLLVTSIYEIRAAKVHQSRLPRRLTLMVSDMEKGYRKARDYEQGRHHHSSRRGHRLHGTKEHYRASRKEGNSDTVPIVFVQRPESAHSSRNQRRF